MGEAIPAVRLGPRVRAASQLRAPERQQRRGDDQGGQCRHDRHRRAGDSHRLRKAQREHGQGGERAGHGGGGEQHRPPCLAEGHADRLAGADPLRELLPKASDQEQRVVDRQAEPEADHQVEREHAQAVELVDPGQDQERAEHGRHPHHERHQGRATPEEHQRQREQERQGQELGVTEILADRARDLLVGDHGTADRHAGGGGERRFGRARHVGVRGAGPDRARDQHMAPIVCHRGRAAGAKHARHLT